ncbi:MAG: ice-binding family protein [Gammaproteobacteria bacterium]|jgi:hypothetical protein
MKTIIARLTLLCSVSFCLNVFATTNIDENPIEFSVVPDISNISCGSAASNAVYTVINTDKYATIIVTPREIINYDDFPDNLVQIQPKSAPGSLTTCDNTYLKPGQTCNINLIITPDSCNNGTILGHIDRVLVVATGTQYKDPTAKIKFSYTKAGAADSFAILGSGVFNYGSTSYVTGDIGHTGTSAIFGPFHVTNGQLYTSATDPNVINANTAFLNLYNQFIANKANCRIHSDIIPPTELQASYYCLTSNLGLNEVSVDGPTVLSGNGDFVFFVDDGHNTCFPNASPSAPCNLHIKSETSFIYKNGASPNNVYWITGTGATIQIESGAELDGTILAGGNISTSPNGPSPASVIGHLWSLGNITLYGDSVAIYQ